MQSFHAAELLSALSKALDLTEGQPSGHCVRSCWIGTNIGIEYGLTGQKLSDLYYTILMKDLGCSSNAARICSLYLADDLAFKRDHKLMNSGVIEALKFVLQHTGLQSGMAERFKATLNIVRNGKTITKELMETRCTQGADIARKLRFSEDVAVGIKNLDEHWDGSGQPEKIRNFEIPDASQIALMSQVIDVFHHNSGKEVAKQEILSRSGTWFNPDIVNAFARISDNSDLWETLVSENLEKIISNMEPAQKKLETDESYLDDVAIAFAQVIDAKSPFTRGHSERVAVYTDMIAEQLNLDNSHRRWLRRGALLHDIGKLGVSNSILDKNGKPTDEEWQSLKKHPIYSYEILSPIPVFKNILPLVRGHHEKLDGSGYPDGLSGGEITQETRVVTVADIFDALTADRPYRKAMPLEKALGIMEKEQETAIDPEFFSLLKEALLKSGTLIAA